MQKATLANFRENRTLERKRQTDEFDHSYAGLDVNEILYQ